MKPGDARYLNATGFEGNQHPAVTDYISSSETVAVRSPCVTSWKRIYLKSFKLLLQRKREGNLEGSKLVRYDTHLRVNIVSILVRCEATQMDAYDNMLDKKLKRLSPD